eukprot:4788870-Pyramimonas_sp.AAC.1
MGDCGTRAVECGARARHLGGKNASAPGCIARDGDDEPVRALVFWRGFPFLFQVRNGHARRAGVVGDESAQVETGGPKSGTSSLDAHHDPACGVAASTRLAVWLRDVFTIVPECSENVEKHAFVCGPRTGRR